jgi:two-component system, chemotaxis family, chemotaxis protein CheY
MRILVVDDSPAMRHYVARTLEMTGIGMSIEQAANGVEAIEKARNTPPNLIITDLNMPGMSGDELIERAAADEQLRDIPFLVVTADAASQMAEAPSGLARRVECLTKPVPPGVLRSSLLNLFEQTALEPAARGAVESVVETMFYSEATYRDPGALSKPSIGASVEFTGPVDGAMSIFVEEQLAVRFAADFLAMDTAEADETMRHQTVSELANILCARVLTRWLPGSAFRYSLPHPAQAPAPGATHRFCFSVLADEPDLAMDFVLQK